jgi:signal peptidase I
MDGSKESKPVVKNTDELISWIKWIVSALLIAFVLRTFVFQMAIVNQISMEPTLHEGHMLVISKINYSVGKPHRGDIVVFKDESENKLLIKRIIGLPGETVEIKNGQVHINGEMISPEYTEAETSSFGQNVWEVPEGHYFVMGDNRPHSRDSRTDSVGFVDRNNIMGKAIFRIWPMNAVGTIK